MSNDWCLEARSSSGRPGKSSISPCRGDLKWVPEGMCQRRYRYARVGLCRSIRFDSENEKALAFSHSRATLRVAKWWRISGARVCTLRIIIALRSTRYQLVCGCEVRAFVGVQAQQSNVHGTTRLISVLDERRLEPRIRVSGQLDKD